MDFPNNPLRGSLSADHRAGGRSGRTTIMTDIGGGNSSPSNNNERRGTNLNEDEINRFRGKCVK